MQKEKIFISNSCEDEFIVTPFVEKILTVGMEIPAENIIYTLEKETSFKSVETFRENVIERVKESTAVIQILTLNYRRSEECLIEMGAVWALSNCVIPMIISPVAFDEIGFFTITKDALKLNSDIDLFRLEDEYSELNGGKKVKQSIYCQQVKEFISIVENLTSIHNRHW